MKASTAVRSCSLIIACLALTFEVSKASLVENAPTGSDVLNFPTSSYDSITTPLTLTSNNGDQVTITPTGNPVVGEGYYGLIGNGHWDQPSAGVNGGTLTFSLDGYTASLIGGFTNYIPPDDGYGDPIITAFNSLGQELESYDLATAAPISTPDGSNAGEFRGISRPEDDISSFEISGAYIILGDLDLSMEVPEPSTWAMMLGGLIFLGICVRCKLARVS